MATAYTALLSVLNDLEAIKNNPYHFFSFESKQIQSLGESVVFLIDFMESCDNFHGASKEAARVLEGAIARAAHAAEDVIESHVVDQIHSGYTKLGKRAPRFLMDLQKVIDDMEFVKRKAKKIDGQARSGLITELQPPNLQATTTTTSDRNAVVGFDDVLLQLLDQLTGGDSNNRRTIPITGMGGIGKTTLAKTAFKHPFIVHCFDVCCWATISQQYVVRDILSKLISGYDQNPNSGTVDELGQQLHQMLFGRRYLIVLDDMWNNEIWDVIRNFFPDSRNGSRIVVTTRLTEVAYYLGSPCFPMRLLDEDTSWDLFCQKTFAGQQGCAGELEDAGKKIVEKCNGLPLAITVVGGHLGRSPRTQQYWENVADDMMNTIFDSGENEELQVFDILSLSYSYLPVHLKPCFLYMGTFFEDKVLMKDNIIKPWIAEGFVKPNQTGESLETIANGYFEDLIERNLVLLDDDILRLTIPGDYYGYFRMHDVIRELCLKIAKKEQFLDFLDAPRTIDREERRVVISTNFPKDLGSVVFDAQRSAPLIRSLTWTDGQLWYDLKLVRVLNAGTPNKIWNKGKFPSANLRYVKCSVANAHGDRLLLPMSHFWNLQTLILSHGRLVISLPYEIWDMVHLRHLQGLVDLPDPLYRDKSHQLNLQTLRHAYNFRLIEEVCDKIPRLKELWLLYAKLGENLERVISHFYPQNLGNFHELEVLYLHFGDDSIICGRGFASSFTFPISLKKLTLYNTRLEWEELTTMVGSLPILEDLCLMSNAVIGSEWTPVEGTFLRLTHLTIFSCDDLVYLNVNSSHFPRLRHLFLSLSPEMNELSLEIGELPSLELLSLEMCNLSLAISALRILDDQEEQGNDCLQLKVFLGEDEDRIRFEEEAGKDGLKRKNIYESEGIDSDKIPKRSARLIKSFAMGELEARKLKCPKTGTEASLMGILVEGNNLAAKCLRESGVTLFKL